MTDETAMLCVFNGELDKAAILYERYKRLNKKIQNYDKIKPLTNQSQRFYFVEQSNRRPDF